MSDSVVSETESTLERCVAGNSVVVAVEQAAVEIWTRPDGGQEIGENVPAADDTATEPGDCDSAGAVVGAGRAVDVDGTELAPGRD